MRSLWLLIVVCLVPFAAAEDIVSDLLDGSKKNCPPHVDHCGIDELPLSDASVTATASVTASVSEGAIQLPVSASAKVVVVATLHANASGRSVDLTVAVNRTAGIGYANNQTLLTKTVTAGASQTFEFPFEIDDAMEPGDVVFLPLVMKAEGAEAFGATAFQVSPLQTVVAELSDAQLVTVGVAALAGGAVGGGSIAALLGALRKSKLQPPLQ